MTTRKRSTLSDRAAIADLIARTANLADIHAGDGKPAVRFCIVSHEAGLGIESASREIAKAMSLEIVDVRTVTLEKGDLEEGTPSNEYLTKTIEQMGPAFILCPEAGAARPGVLRELVAFLNAQDADRDDVHQPRIVMLATNGRTSEAADVVRQAAGQNPVGILSLD